MSDSRRVYRGIKTSLRQLFPKQLNGHQARHLDTLSGMISGIVLNKQCHLEAIARKAPDGSKVESRVKRFSRCLQNEKVSPEMYYLPFVEVLLGALALNGPLVLVIDGSEVGRNCLALMVSVIYKGRALPVVWKVVEGNKGHFPEQSHLELLAQVKTIVPPEAEVIWLGDGEFDGLQFQAAIQQADWHYVFRTAHNRLLCEQDEWFQLNELELQPGDWLELTEVGFTQQAYGPVLVVAWWAADYKEPLYLVSNFELGQEACFWYRKRFRIETFFSDQKSRGFQLHKSHLADPDRLSRLLIATCLAYLWLVYLGVVALRDQWLKLIHRTDRCDLSLFQLGFRLLDHFLNESLSIPFRFSVPPSFSVR